MYKGRRILGVVPARGGSKGIPLKNLKELGGVPLVGLAGVIAREATMIDRSVVSTDNEDIARAAEAYGLDAPFRRPLDISGDRIGDIDVLTDALHQTEQDDGESYDVIVMLQPTSPLRTAQQVEETISRLVDENLDAVWTVSETDSKGHPLKQLTLDDGLLDYFDSAGSGIIARQQLKPVYHRNGIAYALSRQCLLSRKSLMGRRTAAVVVSGHAVSIDTEWDLKLVEFIYALQH